MACPSTTFSDQVGVFDLCSCSISKQDCATLYSTSQNPPFNASSCVQYSQWRTDDVGVCGWAGAPCTQANNASNCYYNDISYCNNGFCRGGLNDSCVDTNHCLSDINCGEDGLCGGYRAWVQFGWRHFGDGINSTEVKLHCISGLGYIDMSDVVRCTDPAANPANHRAKIGPIVGGVVGGVVIVIAAAILWHLRRKRTRGSNSQYPAPSPEVIDSEAPWHVTEASRLSPLILPPGSQADYERPIVEANTHHRSVSIAPHYTDQNFTTLTPPSSTFIHRNEPEPSGINSQQLAGQPSLTVIQPTAQGSSSTSSRRMPSMSTLMHTPEAGIHTELAQMKAQLDSIQSSILTSVRPTSPLEKGTGGKDVPPAYPRQ